ncbi:MAG: GNAT family N-acetyltransferase [Leptolyngbyaceae cyanobacterium]
MISVEYSNRLDPDTQGEILDLLDRAFSDQVYSNNTRFGFFNNNEASHSHYVIIRYLQKVVAVAIVGWRIIDFLGGTISAATVGPLAVHPNFQGQGLGRKLLQGVEDLARRENAQVLYLQGIEGFYGRFGFYPCLAKGKLVVDIKRVNEMSDVSLETPTSAHLHDLSNIYKNTARLVSCSAYRSNENWKWLTTNASSTWYFFKPTLVSLKGQPLAYFCSDSAQPGRIREAAYYPHPEAISGLLAGISVYLKDAESESFEIMTWYDSPLYKYSQCYLDSQFVQYLKTDGSQVMKILSFDHIQALLVKGCASNVDKVLLNEQKDSVKLHFINKQGATVVLSVPGNFLPGLLCGYFSLDVATVDIRESQEIYEAVHDFFGNLKKPFFFQGDNY